MDTAAVNDDDAYAPMIEKEEGKGKRAHVTDFALMIAEIGTLVVYTIFTQYDQGVLPNTSKVLPNQNVYPCFQDVNVMIFIGFGYLMTYIKAQGESAVSFNWIASIFCIQWGILSQAFFQQVFSGSPITYININLESLVWGLFAAATAMITYGALLGKCSLQQLMFLVFWEMIFWGLNVAICTQALQGVDMGGSVIIHAFGCFFGLAASYHFQPDAASSSAWNASNHNSNIIALIGSVFLWMFWPSFNGALAAEGNQQQRIFCNTNLSIAAGCVGAALVARIFYNKLEMTIIMNATLAGGVAIGTCSDIITTPCGAMWVGWVAGVYSAIGFDRIGPWLGEKINLQDTCGVLSLHGMPGVIGGVASIFAVSAVGASYNKDYFPAIASGGNVTDQVLAQVYMILVTLGFSIVSGWLTGFVAKRSMFSPPKILFKDDEHFHDVVSRYPQEYLDQDTKED